jgi:predicted neuraminidase
MTTRRTVCEAVRDAKVMNCPKSPEVPDALARKQFRLPYENCHTPTSLSPMHNVIVFLAAVLGLAEPQDQSTHPAPPQHVGPALARHAVTNRAFTGIPSMAVSPRGRLWVTWYAGVTPGEDRNNYVVLSSSGDHGKTWKEVLVVDPDADGPRRCFDPELWLAPDGRLRWFWADRTGNQSKTDALWMIELANPDSETTSWRPPRCVARGVMMCKPSTLSSGEWVLPVCTWFTDRSSKMVVSTDLGKSWSIRGGANLPPTDRAFDEHAFVERKDGSLWLLSRTKYGIGESVSHDRGRTWPDLKPSAIPHPSARFFVTRLASGNLLLVKHGPLDRRIGRAQLTAYVSTDDGQHWGGGLLLDARSGVSYPDGQQTADSLIHIVYDYNRTTDRQILLAEFREDDAAAGKPVSKAVRLRQLVSQGSGDIKSSKPW